MKTLRLVLANGTSHSVLFSIDQLDNSSSKLTIVDDGMSQTVIVKSNDRSEVMDELISAMGEGLGCDVVKAFVKR